MPQKTSHSRHGPALHGATVALTSARAATSHVRRHYERLYKNKFRFAPWVFFLDMSLLALIPLLIGVNIYLFQRSAPTAGTGLTFSAPPITSGAPMALSATIVSRDAEIKKNVWLIWQLPPGTEILSSQPAATADHRVFLGDLKPSASSTSRVVARLFVPPGFVSFGFTLESDGVPWYGQESRPVVRSGLELYPLIHPTRVVTGAEIPFVLKNATPKPLEDVGFNLEGGVFDNGGVRLSVGTLAPYEARVFLVAPYTSSLTARAFSRSRLLAEQNLPIVFEERDVHLPKITVAPATPGEPLSLITVASSGSRLLVFHPGLALEKDHVVFLDIPIGTQSIQLLAASPTIAGDQWFAMPFRADLFGLTLGPIAKNVITTAFPVSSVARYYAVSGDQIGIGPLPPKVGETTKYWITWKLGATTSDLSNFVLRAELPVGVEWTGRSALPSGGILEQKDRVITWTIPFVVASSEERTASFEVVFTPSSSLRGTVPALVGLASASALENRSGVVLTATLDPLDTNLSGDERGRGKGRVR